MTRSAALRSALVLSLLTCAGCATSGQPGAPGHTGAEGATAAAAGPDREHVEAEHALEVARRKLALTAAEHQAGRAQHAVELGHARTELELAEAALRSFVEVDAPNRVASEELSLQSARDRAQEAADELAQIEVMYADQDLDDLTAEFVVSRGRRNAERAAARIGIQEAALRGLTEHELPQEQMRLELAVRRARASIEKLAQSEANEERSREIALLEAEATVERCEHELAELDASAGSGDA